MTSVSSVEQMLSRLQQDLDVDRLSLTQVHAGSGYCEIVASAGRSLLFPGVRIPLESSTLGLQMARGTCFLSPDFRQAPEWERPVDRLMLDLGFVSGCSLPIAGSPYFVSISSTSPGVAYDGRIAALEGVASEIVDLMPPAADADHAEHAIVCTDDAITGQGLVHLLEQWHLKAAHCQGPAAALEADRLCPATLLVCATYVEGTPVDALVAQLREDGVRAPLVVVAPEDTRHTRELAARAGAIGYACLRDHPDTVLEPMIAAARGRVPYLPTPAFGEPVTLTRREQDVLLDLDEGLRFKQIAARRGITYTTAKSYGRTLFSKLGAHSRAEAVGLARSMGLLDSVRTARQSRPSDLL